MQTFLVVALLLVVASPASAQPGRGQQQGKVPQQNRESRGGPGDDMSPAQLHQLFDAMLAMQAQRVLSLSDEQYAQFLSRLQTLQETRRRSQLQRVRMIGELQRLTSPRNGKPAGEAELTQRLKALHELESRAATDVRRAYDAIDAILTPVQQARFRVLEEQIERRKLELVGRARNRPNQKR